VKVIDAIETALALEPGLLDLERSVLRDYGNMSAPTVLFVLRQLIDRGLPERVMMTAFGPGFTCTGLVLERTA
jgi:alkylresorcinol/alkylpyrone synthase